MLSMTLHATHNQYQFVHILKQSVLVFRAIFLYIASTFVGLALHCGLELYIREESTLSVQQPFFARLTIAYTQMECTIITSLGTVTM